MFNKCKEVIALAFTVVVTFAALADRTITEGDFTFNCNDSTMEASLTKYSGSDTHVTSIPTTVSYQTTEYVRDSDGNIKYDDEGKARTKTVTHTYNVTSASAAFSGNTSVISVTLPSSIKSLSTTFNGCSSLKSVNLNYIEVIGYSTFWDCVSLESMDIPSSVRILGDCAFANCSGLTSVNIPSSVTSIGEFAFQNCSSLTSIETPSTLRNIGTRVFVNCTGLKTAILNGTDLEVADGLFTSCSSLENVVIGSGIASIAEGWYIMGWWSDTYIGMFSYCTNLKTVELKTDRVKYLPKYMFYEAGIEKLILAGGVEEVGDSAFWECSNLVEIEGPFSPVKIGSTAFYGCLNFQGDVDFSRCTSLGGHAFYDCNSLSCNVNLAKLKNIPSYVFENCSSLENVSIPIADNISSCAFHSCSSLKDVSFPEGLTNIADNAFFGCSSLVSIDLPKSLRYLGFYSFYGCSGLKVAKIDGNNLTIENSIFKGCTSLEEAVIGPGVATIVQGSSYSGLWSTTYYSLFEGCTSLKTVDIQSTRITSIQKFMFYQSSVEKVKFAGVISTVYDYAFYGCSSLKTIEGTIKPYTIGSGAFQGCQNFTGQIDFSRCTSLAGSAFEGCSSLAGDLELPKLRQVKSYAFRNCASLTSVELPLALMVESWAFNGCSKVKHVEVSSITNLQGESFSGCRSLTDLRLPATLKYLGARAFGDNTSLTNVNFAGGVPVVGSTYGSSLSFYNCPATARGHYPASYAAEWKAVIDPSTKKWQGLIMEEIATPKLVVDSVFWAGSELSLSWGQTTTGVDVKGPCSLYRGTSGDFGSAICVAKSTLANEFVDDGFLDVEPKTNPLYYWVVQESESGGEPAISAPIITRQRYGVFFGYDEYNRRDFLNLIKPTAIPECLKDARSFASYMGKNGGVLARIGVNCQTSAIESELDSMASRVGKGDILMFYIATHGGQSSWCGEASLLTRDGELSATSLQSAIAKIAQKEAAVVAVINACHSEDLRDELHLDNDNLNVFLNAGLAQCSANVAWISSCRAAQVSVGNSELGYTQFGRDFIHNGLIRGFADVDITGFSYKGGNRDGEITFAELAKYAREFSCGVSDDERAEVNWDNEALLGRLVACTATKEEIAVPSKVVGVSVDRSDRWNVIRIKWDVTQGAEHYRLYRQLKNRPETRKCISYCVLYNGKDDYLSGSELLDEFEYSVVAVNAAGLGEESEKTTGSVGVNLIGDVWRLFDDGEKVTWQSPTAENGMASGFEMTLSVAGELTFNWQTSCESAFELPDGEATPRDHAEFLVDGEVVATSDGESTWKQVSVNLSGGKSHTVTWRYVKDGSGSAGEDCVWISDIQFASLADESSSSDLLDESDYNWFYETTPTAFTESEPFEYNPVLTPENATCQIDICAAIGEVESSALLEEDVEDAQAAIVKVAGAFGLDYAVLTADGWTMVGNGGLGTEGNDGNKISVVIDYVAKPSKVKYMVSGHTLTNADGVALFECAAQKSSVQALVAKGDGTIDCWAGKYEVVNSDVQFVAEGSEIELAANLDTFPSETFQVTGGGTLVIPSDKIPVGGVNRKLHVDGNSKVRFDLSGSGTIPSVTRLFNGVGGAFVIGDNIQLVVPGEGVERVSKLFVKDGNLEARVAERPTIDDGDGSDSAFKVNADSDSTAVSASIGNAVEGFWYGLLTTGVLTSDFALDPDSVKQCTGTGSLRLESSANANSDSGFYRVSVSAEKP